MGSAVESNENESKSAKNNEVTSSPNTPTSPPQPLSPPPPSPASPVQPKRSAEGEEELAQRRKRLAIEIRRIDASTNNLTDNGLFDTRHKKLFGKQLDEEKEREEMDKAYKDIQDNLDKARKSLDNDDLPTSERHVSEALRALDKALYAPPRWWRFSNVYAGLMWIYLVGFLVAVLVFYLIQLDRNVLGLYPPGVLIQEAALHATTWGAVGAILRGLWFLKDKVTDRRYRNAFRIYILSTPFLGALFGAIFYFLIVSGLFIVAPAQVPEILTNQTNSGSNGTNTTNQTGATNQANGTSAGSVSTLAIIPIAALAGFNWEWAVMILKRIGESFKPDTEPEDKIDR